MPAITAVSRSVEETRHLAAALAQHLRPGDAICLRGDLGAGKTTFMAALVAAMGSDDEVLSPTFTLENRYLTPQGPVVHQDLYRFDGDADADLLASLGEARDEGAVVAVEWGEPITADLIPYLDLRIQLDAAVGEPPRRITLTPHPDAWGPSASLRTAWEGR